MMISNAPTKLNIEVEQDNSFSITLQHFEDDEVTPIPLTGVFKMVVSKNPDGRGKIIELTEGNGLTVLNHELTIATSAEDNIHDPKTYYYGIRADFSDGSSWPAYKGTYTINPYAAKP